jgi:hypothetical protein
MKNKIKFLYFLRKVHEKLEKRKIMNLVNYNKLLYIFNFLKVNLPFFKNKISIKIKKKQLYQKITKRKKKEIVKRKHKLIGELINKKYESNTKILLCTNLNIESHYIYYLSNILIKQKKKINTYLKFTKKTYFVFINKSLNRL